MVKKKRRPLLHSAPLSSPSISPSPSYQIVSSSQPPSAMSVGTSSSPSSAPSMLVSSSMASASASHPIKSPTPQSIDLTASVCTRPSISLTPSLHLGSYSKALISSLTGMGPSMPLASSQPASSTTVPASSTCPVSSLSSLTSSLPTSALSMPCGTDSTPFITSSVIVTPTSTQNHLLPSIVSVMQVPPITTAPLIAPDSSSSALLWAARIKTSLRNLKKCADPEFLEDGTPVVVAPDSVILESSEIWKDHLIAHFTTTPPAAEKIYADLNPIWGKFGNISVRKFTTDSCLILIPAESTRAWVLDVGYWQAGNCSFTVSKWTPTADLHPQKLTSIPIWAILRNIPPQLYSLAGISIIASAIGEPMHTERSRLSHIQVGEAKVKVEILLDKPLPPTIMVRDSKGNSIKIDVDYPRPPPRCTCCSNFGHTVANCPTSKNSKKKEKRVELKKMVVEVPSVPVEAPTAVTVPTEASLPEKIAESSVTGSFAILPSSSLDAPDHEEHAGIVEDQPSLELDVSRESSESITSSQFDDVEEVLYSVQKSLSLPPTKSYIEKYKDLSPKGKKRARKQQRQALKEADNLAAKVLRLKAGKDITTPLTREASTSRGSSSQIYHHGD